MGTFSDDRQKTVERLLLEVARVWPRGRFIVVGPQYPDTITWPRNVKRVEHLAPPEHRNFYNSQGFTLNVTRADMIAAGYSPSVRLFEAAACATPVISDDWAGLETFFEPGKEILIARHTVEVRDYLRSISTKERDRIGRAALRRVLAHHTADHRAAELESYVRAVRTSPARVTAAAQ
jgi:spore maturation protein CgeB